VMRWGLCTISWLSTSPDGHASIHTIPPTNTWHGLTSSIDVNQASEADCSLFKSH